MSRLRESLDLLRRLNEARRIGQHQAALALNEELELRDWDIGYSRPIRTEGQVEQPGERRGRNLKTVRK